MNRLAPEQIQERVAKGAFKPHLFLTNVALAHYQGSAGTIATKFFPPVPVALSTSFFHEFDKGDLTRIGVGRKPAYGKVAPAVFGKTDHNYRCEVDQIITGIDSIAALDFQRAGTSRTVDPRLAKVRFVVEQMRLHQDNIWAGKFFNEDAWNNVYEGADTNPVGKQFWFLDNDNCDPVDLFNRLRTIMRLEGLRMPNKMCLGMNAYSALQTNPSILDRIKYMGRDDNPADVSTNTLAQLFKLDEVAVAETAVNRAKIGEDADMEFVCNPNDILLCYTTDAPAIDEPSAGYTFTWDMLGNGQYLPILQWEGENGTHTDFVEGLLATDHKVAAPDLGVFLKNAVSPDFDPTQP